MIKVTTFSGQRVAVFGLGISGLSAATALMAGGAELAVWDERETSRAAALEAGLPLVDLADADWAGFDGLLLSPGVPLTHPKPHWTVEKARAAGVPIIGDTELFFLEYLAHGGLDNNVLKNGGDDQVIVITGTNGKSTVTALCQHILMKAGVRAVMGGNIGRGVLDLPAFGAGTVYVLELSSYQIDLTPSLRPRAAALLNISPDHLDRHGTVAHYAEVKSRVFDQLEAGDRAIVSIDDEYSRGIAAGLETGGDVWLVGSEGEVPQGACFSPDGFDLFVDGEVCRRVDLSGALRLRGAHNMQNAAFAFLLADAVSDNADGLIEGLLDFPGLAHRCQEIGCYQADGRRVLFVNDSKATNAEASAPALRSYTDIYWLAGGRAKTGGIAPLADEFASVKRAFLYGEAAEDFAATLKTAGVAFELFDDLAAATDAAFQAALADQTSEQAAVLLSPAAASFDQFPNFEVRGEAFVAAVQGLEERFGLGQTLLYEISDGC